MTDDGGRAPEPGDLGSDWVEALLGSPRVSKADPAAPAARAAPATPDTPAPPTSAPPGIEATAGTSDDLDPGAALAEAFFGTPTPAPSTIPAEPPAAAEPAAPAEQAPSAPLLPPVAVPPPTWAEPEEPVHPAWAEAIDPAPHPHQVDGTVAAPSVEQAQDPWGLPPLVEGPATESATESVAPLEHAPPPSESSARTGLPYLGIQPVAEGEAVPGAPVPDALVDPTAPPPPGPAAQTGVLDLRPAALAGPAPASGRKARRQAKAPTTAKDRRRHRLLAGVGAVLLLVVGLVAFQVLAEDDGEPDAVLTADAVQIENDRDDEERGISVGSGEDEAAEDEAGEGDAAESDETTAAEEAAAADAPGGADAGGDASGSGGTGAGSAPAGPGRLAVSASSLEFGSSGSRTLSIRNEGGSSLSWSASTSGAGFAIAGGRSGSLAPGQALDLQVSFSPNGLPEGAANGTLSIDGRAVALRATVNRPPAISNISWASCGATSRLRMTVTDESGISSVVVAGTSPSGAGYRKTAVSQGSGSYRADIGPFSGNGQITYFVEATDTRGNVARSAVQYRPWNDGC